MENLKTIFIGIFILISSILVVFFCPITVTVQTTTTTQNYSTSYTPGKYQPNISTSYDTDVSSYTYEDNIRIWELEKVSRNHGPSVSTNPRVTTNIKKSPNINFERLLLEELIILGITFVVYLISKYFLAIS